MGVEKVDIHPGMDGGQQRVIFPNRQDDTHLQKFKVCIFTPCLSYFLLPFRHKFITFLVLLDSTKYAQAYFLDHPLDVGRPPSVLHCAKQIEDGY